MSGAFSGIEWPAWQVPPVAAVEWSRLQVELGEVLLDGRGPVCTREPELWESGKAAVQAVAAEACGWCPLLRVCGEYALAAGEKAGVWGGLTPAARLDVSRGAA